MAVSPPIAIMAGMLILRTEHWLRVGAGFGLLLLLATQEKLCPWVLTPPSETPSDAVDASAAPPDAPAPAEDADPSRDARTKRKAPPLPLLLPDATAPRWPAFFGDVSVDHVISARNGVVACGFNRPPPAPAPSPAAVVSTWRRLDTALLDFLPARPATARRVPAHPALGTTLLRTGPPRV